VVVAAETRAMHQAASAASPLGWRKPVGTQSPWPPSALGAPKRTRSWRFTVRRIRHDVASLRCSAGMTTEPALNALLATSAAAVPVWASMMSAARTSMGTAFHAKERVVGAAETHALRQAASAASLKARRVHGTPSAMTLSAERCRCSARTATATSSSAQREMPAAATAA